MKVTYNEKRASLHRFWLLLGYLAKNKQGVRLQDIIDNTSMPSGTVGALIEKINSDQIPGVAIGKNNDQLLVIKSWGPMLNESACIDFYNSILEQSVGA